MSEHRHAALWLLGACLLLSACESVYYGGMEKVGIHKRDILVDRVQAAQQSQREGQQQFKSALEQFRAVVDVPGGELEAAYDKLNGEYEDSVAAAKDIRDRIDKVESVAEALFKEWEQELSQYSNARLKQDSAAKLRQTRSQYQRLIGAMRGAERRIEPVLQPMRDQVLYLKHNLNARAIGSLRGELAGISGQVDTLIRSMEQSIAEADRFIQQMKTAE
jgi:hypothetical protein